MFFPRFSRLYERTAEFRSRNLAFDFAVIAQTVVDIALETRKSLAGWWNKMQPATPKLQNRKQHQLVLELDGIASFEGFQQ